MATDGMVQALRLNMAVSAPQQAIERDLVGLHLASGKYVEAIAIIDPKGDRDDFVKPVRWGSPGQAFQLAEAYRAQGNLDAARRLYGRAQEAAVAFDLELSQRMLAQQVRFQTQFGPDMGNWLPPTSAIRQLPDLIRTVSQKRLNELDGK